MQTWNWSGGKIYVMNTDGTNQRLLADTGYNLGVGCPTVFINNIFFEAKTIDGIDYIATSFVIVGEGFGNSAFILSPDTIIINASTGEWTVLSVPE
jgi:hypothetical protein